MGQWDYFVQEARNLKVSRGKEEQNFEAGLPASLQLGLVFILPGRNFRLRVRMEYGKKDRFSMPRKSIEAAYQSSWQVQTFINLF